MLSGHFTVLKQLEISESRAYSHLAEKLHLSGLLSASKTCIEPLFLVSLFLNLLTPNLAQRCYLEFSTFLLDRIGICRIAK